MKRIKCTVAYDGTLFNGYQRQPGQRTVQGEIEAALEKISKQPVTIHSSGRKMCIRDRLVRALDC